MWYRSPMASSDDVTDGWRGLLILLFFHKKLHEESQDTYYQLKNRDFKAKNVEFTVTEAENMHNVKCGECSYKPTYHGYCYIRVFWIFSHKKVLLFLLSRSQEGLCHKYRTCVSLRITLGMCHCQLPILSKNMVGSWWIYRNSWTSLTFHVFLIYN